MTLTRPHDPFSPHARPDGDDDAEAGRANPAVLDGTIPEVEAYAAEHPEHAAELLEAERAGKNRSTLVAKLEHVAAPPPEA